MDTIVEIFLTFAKIGSLSFGGGYAMIPFLQAEALSHNWLTMREFTDIVAISQVTPGPVAVNMATFVGYTQALIPGSLAATFAVCLPSFAIVSILVKFFVKFGETKFVKRVFLGLKPTVTGLIFAATVLIAQLEFFKNSSVDIKTIAISAVCVIAMVKFKVNPIYCIVFSAVLGVFIF